MKIAVLKVKEKSSWLSCQSISKNLLSTYTEMSKNEKVELEVCPYSSRRMETELLEIFQGLKKKGISRVVIIDHFPYPVNLFEVFAKIFAKLNFHPEIFVHVYGCLTVWLHTVNAKDPFFKKCKIHFITASEAQRELLGQYLSDMDLVSVANFPVDSNVFAPAKNRAEIRKELGFNEKDILLIYTGRAHIQKNLPMLLQNIAELMQKNKNIKFLFAGNYDDSPINFLEYRYAYGTNQSLVQTALKEGGIEKQFIELGSLSQKDLVKYLNAADIFCSLSMYSDEDYGYAPLEAMSVGCSSLLSAWGGYKEFSSPYTSFVKVRREYINKTDSLFISPTEIQTKLQAAISKLPLEREEIAQHFKERFSIPAMAERIFELHKNISARQISFNQTAFAKYKKRRAYPLDPYSFMDIYHGYYR